MTTYFKLDCSHCKKVYAGSEPRIVMRDFYQHQIEDHADEVDDLKACKEKYEENKEKTE